jgi:hypothetical protein
LLLIACAIPPDATQRDVDRLDDAVPAHPNASQAHSEASTPDDVIVAKAFDVNGEPHFHELEPDGSLAAADRGGASRGVSRRAGRINSAPQSGAKEY